LCSGPVSPGAVATTGPPGCELSGAYGPPWRLISGWGLSGACLPPRCPEIWLRAKRGPWPAPRLNGLRAKRGRLPAPLPQVGLRAKRSLWPALAPLIVWGLSGACFPPRCSEIGMRAKRCPWPAPMLKSGCELSGASYPHRFHKPGCELSGA